MKRNQLALDRRETLRQAQLSLTPPAALAPAMDDTMGGSQAGFNDAVSGAWLGYGLTHVTTTTEGFYPAPGGKG